MLRDDRTIHRVLRPGPRPFIAFGILFGAIILFMLGVSVAYRRFDHLEPLAMFVIMYVVLAAGMLRARIVVRERTRRNRSS